MQHVVWVEESLDPPKGVENTWTILFFEPTGSDDAITMLGGHGPSEFDGQTADGVCDAVHSRHIVRTFEVQDRANM